MSGGAVGARSVQARLALTFARAGGRTVLRSAERTPPLHVQRPLYLDPHRPALAHLALLNATAGLFAGDSHHLHLTVGAAEVALTTPAMTRVFRMPAGHAEIQTHVDVAADGYLEYFPEATLLCGGARLRQSTVLSLVEGASVAWAEVLAFGRTSHGESAATCGLRQSLRVVRDGEPVLAESLTFSAGEPPNRPGIIGRWPALGTLLLVGEPSLHDQLLERIRRTLPDGVGLAVAATRLPFAAGIGVRALGASAWAVRQALRPALGAFRSLYLPIGG